MRYILDGKVYDTEKSEAITSDKSKIFWRTEKGNYFFTWKGMEEGITLSREDAIKEIGKVDPNVAIAEFDLEWG